jgi:hypothetical protein
MEHNGADQIHRSAAVRPRDLLAAWEAGLMAGTTTRALLLHSVARPDAGTDELLSRPVGERDADLFALRRALFGEQLDVRVGCGACGEEMEFDFDADFYADADAVREWPWAGPLTVEAEGWHVEFRLPTTGDLVAAERRGADRARSELLARTVLRALQDGEEVPADKLPTEVQRHIAQAVAEADPYADITLTISCPECGQATRAELDIASYLWAELDAWARATLLDVHLLATAYGWSEPEILALSPLRRRYYLELCADA